MILHKKKIQSIFNLTITNFISFVAKLIDLIKCALSVLKSDSGKEQDSNKRFISYDNCCLKYTLKLQNQKILCLKIKHDQSVRNAVQKKYHRQVVGLYCAVLIRPSFILIE